MSSHSPPLGLVKVRFGHSVVVEPASANPISLVPSLREESSHPSISIRGLVCIPGRRALVSAVSARVRHTLAFSLDGYAETTRLFLFSRSETF